MATQKRKPVAKKEEATATTRKSEPKDTFEFKDRLYVLKGDKKPLVYIIPSKHSGKKPLQYFDESTRTLKEIRYATNMNSPFADEQQGDATLGRIIFRDGALNVPRTNQALQKLLSLYHPLKDVIYEEYDPVQESVDEMEVINLEIDALMMARDISIDLAEAIMRVEIGSQVDKMTSSELKRDLMIFAKRQPGLFLELANDENVELRNIGVKANSMGLIKLSPDQRTFTYGDSNRKLMTVPFDEHPYSALAAWFKTDEGMEVYKTLVKKLKM